MIIHIKKPNTLVLKYSGGSAPSVWVVNISYKKNGVLAKGVFMPKVNLKNINS